MGKQIHVIFFPFMAQGHMLPTLDMAKLFASYGLKTTIITTPLNLPVFAKAIQRIEKLGLQVGIQVFKFPATEVGLPEGCESADKLTKEDMFPSFMKAASMLQEQLDQYLQECRPDCLVSDMFFPWTTDSSAKYDIPRLVFHGTSYFGLCASECVRLYKPFKNVSKNEPFVIPNLPHEIKLTTMQMHPTVIEETESDLSKIMNQVMESDSTSYGVIVNSFHELEPDYADHYRTFFKRRAWQIGPLSLFNKDTEDKAHRGKEASIDEHECLEWLDSRNPNSVIYVCFGSIAKFTASQLYEIAMGLEASGQQFIWVVNKENIGEEYKNWLPEGFEERIKDKGLIIRGWAPQVLILDHETIGGFVTHCGWNSILEGICAGLPMVTWPLFAEQFFNEKLVTEILKTGIAVGSKKWNRLTNEGVTREAVAKAVKSIMVGQEAEEKRSRARELKKMAKEAIEEGGSSYSSLNALIQELSSYQSIKCSND